MKQNNLAKFIADGTIKINELAEANKIIADANLVKEAIIRIKEKFLFHIGERIINCYKYIDGDYMCIGQLDFNGNLKFSSNMGQNHFLGEVNLNNDKEVLLILQEDSSNVDGISFHLRKFLEKQISKLGFFKGNPEGTLYDRVRFEMADYNYFMADLDSSNEFGDSCLQDGISDKYDTIQKLLLELSSE